MAVKQDEKRDYMLKELGKTSGALPDIERDAYTKETSFSGTEINQLKQQWLYSFGQPLGNITDEWFNYLRSQGYKGAIQDMERAFYRDNS